MRQSTTSFYSMGPVKHVQEIKTEEILSTLINQSLADIERFKHAVGGEEQM
jgi:hypothetical protein